MGTDWLAAAGVDASWKLFPSGPDIMKAMTDGEIDLSYIGLPPAMIGIARGVPVRCIAGGHVEGTVLVARDRYRGIDELGDEKAVLTQFSVIGCPPKGSIHDIIIRDLLQTLSGPARRSTQLRLGRLRAGCADGRRDRGGHRHPGPRRRCQEVRRRQDRHPDAPAVAE